MTEVSNAELQNFFATIFNIDPTYVVPKQANFYNPTSNLSASLKPITWLAYRLKRNEPRTWAMPAVETTIVNGEPIENSYYESYMIAYIELQFVGANAETYANSIQFFPKRQDVLDNLVDCEGVIMLDDFKVFVSDFSQEGLNTVFSYNVNMKITWTKKQIVNQELAQGIDFIGNS